MGFGWALVCEELLPQAYVWKQWCYDLVRVALDEFTYLGIAVFQEFKELFESLLAFHGIAGWAYQMQILDIVDVSVIFSEIGLSNLMVDRDTLEGHSYTAGFA